MSLVQKHNSNLSFDEIKKQAIDAQPLVTEMSLSRITLGRNQTIKIDNKIMPIQASAYTHFLKNVLKINPSFIAQFKKATNEEAELAMLNTLQAGLASKGKESVRVIANTKNHTITSFLDAKKSYITNDALLDMFEQMMNRFPRLELKDFYLDPHSGKIDITARNLEQLDLGTIENFNGGITFSNHPINGTNIFTNVLRLICTNGMIGDSKVPVNFSNTANGMKKLFEEIGEMSKNGFISANFVEQQKLNEMHYASLAELDMLVDLLVANSDLTRETIDGFIPYTHWIHELKQKGVPVEKLNAKQKQNCPVKGITKWDVVNHATDFGSHNYGMNADYSNIQKGAAKIFVKDSDTANLVIF